MYILYYKLYNALFFYFQDINIYYFYKIFVLVSIISIYFKILYGLQI